MASPSEPTGRRLQAPAPAVESDDVVRHIFLLLDSPADLARACAVSPAFRRVITDPCFLCRFQTLHPPPLLGILSDGFLPAEPPHPSAGAARAFVAGAAAADFHCSFLPSPGPWYWRDSRDGRFLFSSEPKGSCCYTHKSLGRRMRLAVCDPLHRRYVVLPPIPDDLDALVVVHHEERDCTDDVKPFFAPSGHDDEPSLAPPAGPDLKSFKHFLAPPGDDEEDMTSFRVMCLAQCKFKLVLFVFSPSGTGSGRWRAATFHGWSARPRDDPDRHGSPWMLQHGYAHGGFCWVIYTAKKALLVVDTRGATPQFSFVNLPPRALLPPGVRAGSVVVVEASTAPPPGEDNRGGWLGMVTVCRHVGYDVCYLWYTVLGDDGEWRQEATIHLPLRHRDYRVLGVAGGYLLLEGTPVGREVHMPLDRSRPDVACFTLDPIMSCTSSWASWAYLDRPTT